MTSGGTHALHDKRIGFIGGGAMAEALAGGLIGAGIAAARIAIAEPRAERRAQLEDRLGVVTHADNPPIVQAATGQANPGSWPATRPGV